MRREIIAEGNEGWFGGWFRCSSCDFDILLHGKVFNRARQLESQKMPIICGTYDLTNGLIPEIRKPKYPAITGPLYGGN